MHFLYSIHHKIRFILKFYIHFTLPNCHFTISLRMKVKEKVAKEFFVIVFRFMNFSMTNHRLSFSSASLSPMNLSRLPQTFCSFEFIFKHERPKFSFYFSLFYLACSLPLLFARHFQI